MSVRLLFADSPVQLHRLTRSVGRQFQPINPNRSLGGEHLNVREGQ